MGGGPVEIVAIVLIAPVDIWLIFRILIVEFATEASNSICYPLFSTLYPTVPLRFLTTGDVQN